MIRAYLLNCYKKKVYCHSRNFKCIYRRWEISPYQRLTPQLMSHRYTADCKPSTFGARDWESGTGWCDDDDVSCVCVFEPPWPYSEPSSSLTYSTPPLPISSVIFDWCFALVLSVKDVMVCLYIKCVVASWGVCCASSTKQSSGIRIRTHYVVSLKIYVRGSFN